MFPLHLGEGQGEGLRCGNLFYLSQREAKPRAVSSNLWLHRKLRTLTPSPLPPGEGDYRLLARASAQIFLHST